MQAIQQLVPTKVGQKKDNRVVSISAHGAATVALGPYFIQITTSWDKAANHKWTQISLTVVDAEKLRDELTAVITTRKGTTKGTATFKQIAKCLNVEDANGEVATSK